MSENEKEQNPPKPDTSIRGAINKSNPNPRKPDTSIQGHSNKDGGD